MHTVAISCHYNSRHFTLKSVRFGAHCQGSSLLIGQFDLARFSFVCAGRSWAGLLRCLRARLCSCAFVRLTLCIRGGSDVLLPVSKGTDWERSPTYPAEYLHQVFDDEPEETIRGHVNPRVDLFFAAGSLRPFIMFESDSKQHSTATDVVGKLKEWYPEGVATRDLDSYLRAVDSDAESWTPPGEQVGEFAAPSGESGETYLVYKVEGEAALADARPFHDRAQVLSVFYIDGARLLDVDPRWEIFYLCVFSLHFYK